MAKQVKIYDLYVKYKIDYRDIKYPRLELKTGDLLLVLPKDYEDHEGLIEKHKDWIYNKISIIRDSMKESQKKALDFKRTDKELRKFVRSYVENISPELNININDIYFRMMKSKWGSCSSNKNLTINSLLKYLPKDLIEYVIFHEMVHLIERRHNERFWEIIIKKFPNYQKMEKYLLIYWFSTQKAIEGPSLQQKIEEKQEIIFTSPKDTNMNI